MPVVNHNYSTNVDIIVCLLSMLLFFLLTFSYNNKNFHFKILQVANISTFLAGISSIIYNKKVINNISKNMFDSLLMYISHHIRSISLIIIWVMIILYLYTIVYSKNFKKNKTNAVIVCILFITIYSVIEIISPITKFGFFIKNSIPHENFIVNPFVVFYLICAITYIIFFINSRKIFPKKTFFYLSIVTIYCFSIMLICAFLNTTSFNVFTFYIPILSVYIIFHGNKFDINSGTLGPESFFSFISELLAKNKDFTIINIYVYQNNNFKNDKSTINDLSKECGNIFKNDTLFKKNDNILNIIIKQKYSKNIKNKINELENMINNYRCNNNDIRITVLKHYDNIDIINTQQIIDFNKYLLEKTSVNNTYIQTQDDYNNFLKDAYIKEELTDIKIKNNLDDERVLVYCQPIINSRKNYENAEMLMRLNLKKLGIVSPNDFIPIAEKYDLIHNLTLIMLNKTCKEIKRLLQEGYNIDRFSINFSANEFNNPFLLEEVIKIIKDIDIPYNKLAFEITETSFSKINNLKNIMKQLIEKGIKFYLDDFGTGYSNIDRIAELPFSTIKFDRSLVISSLKKDNTKFIVKNLCNIFNDLNFEILFEGIETDKDEILCENMGANYLQGYKYSKPIPVDKIQEYLTKE